MKHCIAIMVSTVIWAMGANAQSLDDIREQAAFLEEFNAMLSSESEPLRKAALASGLSSEDPTIRKTAMDFALSSENPALRTQALSTYLSLKPSFRINIEVPETMTEQQSIFASYWTPLQISVEEYDPRTLEFSGRTGGNRSFAYTGRVIEDGYEIIVRDSGINLSIVSPTLLAGSIRGNGAELSVTMRLQ